eukprot:scaffold31574_cov124-Isochrysis_galbana.AAC.3
MVSFGGQAWLIHSPRSDRGQNWWRLVPFESVQESFENEGDDGRRRKSAECRPCRDCPMESNRDHAR